MELTPYNVTCCKRTVDTREFKSSPDFFRLDNTGKVVERGRY